MNLSADKKSLAMSIQGDLTADQVETLISDLGALRSNMLPAVPDALPAPGGGLGALPSLSVQDDPDLSAIRLSNGRIRLFLRNCGLGWLVFHFPPDQARVLRDFLIANTPEEGPGHNVFSQERGPGDASH